MGTISRWMPPVHRSEMSWSSVAAFGTAVVGLEYFVPVIGVPIAGLVAFVVTVSEVLACQDARGLAALARSRAREDIGSFARPFRQERVDMWIVRAVWDALGPWMTTSTERVAVRPDDLLVEELKIDDEDLGDLIVEVAGRTGRSLEQVLESPGNEAPRTVRDLVHFVNAQPRRAAA